MEKTVCVDLLREMEKTVCVDNNSVKTVMWLILVHFNTSLDVVS